jgi:UDP-N-acetylmuramate--alanine ligase
MYHFIGIKGSGMSALAQIMKELGYEVQGSDVEKHFFTEEGLIEKNIPIFPYQKENIQEKMKIIRGESIREDHPEVIEAEAKNLKIYSYHEMVGKLTERFKTVCVAGCHGKTTTTAMLSHILKNTVGANYLIGDGTGFAALENTYFVLESCEYRRHFLSYKPYYAIITNIDLDHVDYFKNMDDVIDAYREYANKAEKLILACGDDPYTHSLEVTKPIFFYGLGEDNDIRAINVEYKTTGISFEVEVEGNYYGCFDLPIYGKHQLLDALSCIAVCFYERLEAKEVQKIFKTFKGARRRFTETIVGDSIIIDDYAHHPNEVSATIHAVKQKYEGKKVITIFQPHTFSRTQEFMEDFARVFGKVDEAYFLEIHPAREKQEDYPDIKSESLVEKLSNGHLITMEESEVLCQHKGAVFVFMSPNDLSVFENKLIERLK